MKNTNYQLTFSEAAASYVSDIHKSFEGERNKMQERQNEEESPAPAEETLTRAEVEKMLGEHLSRIENLILKQEKQIEQMASNTPEAEVVKRTEGFLAKIKEAMKYFTDTVKYLVGDMTDDARLKVKNGINSRILRVNSSIKSLGKRSIRSLRLRRKSLVSILERRKGML